MAQYGDSAASRPARLFRNYYEVARIPGNRSASTYETLWPGYKLYRWAGKTPDFDGVRPPVGRAVCFVHVGKTAGSTVGCALGFRLHCRNTRHLPGQLPEAATNMFHGDVYDCPSTSNFYLFVMRDPLARLRSAFVYGRMFENKGEGAMAQRSSKLFTQCAFSSIDELASSGLMENGDASEECKQRARDMVRGNELLVFHTYYNYQFHLEMIPHDSNILVIRNEHMEEDWTNVERMLGGTPEKNLTFAHANSRQKEARDLILGDRERRRLCHELCVEIQYYKMLLRLALNINKTQYQTSIKELQASCPYEARLKQCDFHTPNIEVKLLLARGHRRNETRSQSEHRYK